ncbi:exonuclease domain-containing protein [Arthrobacter sp. Br18]|uniref:exonuclease domain-containing protein n=1 Tax=Arthrobacter sp. Br18 TaxID=1312954 RepID=UPI0004B899FA|nr:exonuclease domain-containing protein [Arthrobacter sp. Br18]
MQGLNFTAIDFETANSSRGSACAVGLAKVQGGQVVETASWLIRPPAAVSRFDPRNIAVHGIRASDVAGAATWKASLRRIVDFVGMDALVAHNASFDRSVLRSACSESGLEVPELTFHCSLGLARRLLDLEVNKLPAVARALGLGAFQHHDAGNDSEVCAQAVLAMARSHGLHSLDLLWPPVRSSPTAGSHRYSKSPALAELPQPDRRADPAGPLYGQVVVFTGDLARLSREDAMQHVASLGATNANNITKKTTLLVIGQQDPVRSPAVISANSGKERKALQYIAAGQTIRAVSEKELLGWLGIDASPRRTMTAAPRSPAVDRSRRGVEERDRTPESIGQIEGAVTRILKWIGNRRGK